MVLFCRFILTPPCVHFSYRLSADDQATVYLQYMRIKAGQGEGSPYWRCWDPVALVIGISDSKKSMSPKIYTSSRLMKVKWSHALA